MTSSEANLLPKHRLTKVVRKESNTGGSMIKMLPVTSGTRSESIWLAKAVNQLLRYASRCRPVVATLKGFFAVSVMPSEVGLKKHASKA